MSAKSISIVTTSIFGSAFLGIFLSTIIFAGPSSEFSESESLNVPKTSEPIDENVQKPEPVPEKIEEKPKVQESEPIPEPEEPTPDELDAEVTQSSSTGAQ